VNGELTLLAIVVGALAVTRVCRRLDVSAPLALVVVGIAASFVPGVEVVEVEPDVVLLVVLTPLLYSAALESSYLGIRANARPIGLLAVGLVAFTTVVVGLVAWWVVPGLSLAAALVLGAVVAPPDAVSALAVGRRLGLPRRVMTILGGESLINDATALTLFRVFVAAAAGTGVTVLGATGMFLLAAVGGTAIGLAIGWVVHRIRRCLDDANVESALGPDPASRGLRARESDQSRRNSVSSAVVVPGCSSCGKCPVPGTTSSRYAAPAHLLDDAAVRTSAHGSSAPWICSTGTAGGRATAAANRGPSARNCDRNAQRWYSIAQCATPGTRIAARYRDTASVNSAEAAHSPPAQDRMMCPTRAPSSPRRERSGHHGSWKPAA